MADSIPVNNNSNEKMIQWAYHYLLFHEYILIHNQPEEVQITPWSYVVRFATSAGYIYLKHTPEQLSLEAAIIQIFREQFHASVPKIIACNDELHCFLMNDAGRPLREILKQRFDEGLLCKAIDQFTSLQITVADRAEVFLRIGVPDWRLDKLPALYSELLSQKEVLIADGLSEIELKQLEDLLPTVMHLCTQLSQYSIKESFVQPDFNDNNTLIDPISKNITMIDLGEIAISHPFFSLLNFLQQIKKHHALTEEDEAYLRVKGFCLKNYMKFESKKHLLDAFAIANILFFIYWALADFRLINACDKTKFTSAFQLQGRPSIQLKGFIAACMNS